MQGALNCWAFPIPAAASWPRRWAWTNGAASCSGRRRPAGAGLCPARCRQRFRRGGSPAGPAVFVKPANEGSSVGITKVKQPGDLAAGLPGSPKHDALVLAERFIGGGEFTVAILGERPARPAGDPHRADATEFYDYEAKYFRDDTRYLLPSGLPPSGNGGCGIWRCAPSKVLGCRGWGRVDVLLDAGRRALSAGDQHRPGHDRPQPGADGGASGGHRIRPTSV
jgi:hypothetical protein